MFKRTILASAVVLAGFFAFSGNSYSQDDNGSSRTPISQTTTMASATLMRAGTIKAATTAMVITVKATIPKVMM